MMVIIFIKFTVIFGIAILLRILEYSNDVKTVRSDNNPAQRINLYYNMFYWHLPMSMASLGLLCDMIFDKPEVHYMIFIILSFIFLILLGCICRGIFSNGNPEIMNFYDKDWRWGFIVPNVIGLFCLAMSVIISQ